MKRFSAAAIAAATAVTLVAAPAQAQQITGAGYHKEGGSSKVTDAEATAYIIGTGIVEGAQKGVGWTPTFRNLVQDGTVSNVLDSSVRNDANEGYKLGTTFDILWGTGLTVALLAIIGGVAVQQGFVQLPQLPALPF